MSAPTIDFLGRQRTAWLGWILLGAGLAALAASLWLGQRWTGQRAQRDAEVRSRQEAAEQAQRAALRPVALSPDERRLQHIAPRLRQPWLPALRLIENVTEPPVYLLALSVDPASGGLRIDGEAPTFEDALSYVRSLDEPGLLGPAALRSHEQATDPAGRSVVRFSILTRWASP
ncbi:hypothetical protein [Ideonella sp. YS5]|uniref:hypothetical protein n=1 Tax=Ideonella sp. YS5 TaxID=3453714 RepID=UPI003EEEB5B5